MYSTVRDFHLPPLTSVITVKKKLKRVIEMLVFEGCTWNLILVPRG
jgi:hypothetical protein